MKKPDALEFIVESIYHCAQEKPLVMVSEGGPAVDDRWWQAIREAYTEGYKACKRGDSFFGKAEELK